MGKMKNIVRGGILAFGAVAIMSVPAAAACKQTNFNNHPDIRAQQTSTATPPPNFPVKCAGGTFVDGTVTYQTWGRNSAACSKAASMITDPECGGNDLNTVIQAIVNTIVFVVGIVAVVMIILGGIQYSTSQGDPGKVKKAKDTILYGIIGLVVAILAFAIVNFVLTSIF